MSGREYGGFSHTLPFQFLDKPSSTLLYIAVAVCHKGLIGAQGSKSNTPKACMISIGVYHSSVAFAERSKLVFMVFPNHMININRLTQSHTQTRMDCFPMCPCRICGLLECDKLLVEYFLIESLSYRICIGM